MAAAVLALSFLIIYLPDLGHGFISDDHRWIHDARLETAGDVVRVFQANVGFYRPIVALTFGLDFSVWGPRAFGYALTNLALLTLNVVLLARLAARFGLPPAARLLACGIWALNVHAVNMALLWLSGRTALLAGAFGLLAMLPIAARGTRRHEPPGATRACAVAAAWALIAMLCKEEAIVLPALAAAWLARAAPPGRGRVAAAASAWPLALSAAAYAVLRMQSGAFGPVDAPPYYRLSLDPALLAVNVLSYLDRGATVAIVTAAILIVVARRRPVFEDGEWRAVVFGAWWFLGWYAVTVFLPVRSSLYALVPSMGAALIAGAVASAVARQTPQRFARTAAALVTIVVLAIPIYRSRNVRWVRPAELSTMVVDTLVEATRGDPAGGHVLLVDDAEARYDLDTAFGALLPEALAVWLGPAWTGRIADEPVAAGTGATLVFRLEGGRLVPLPR
ncbi:MAG: hypothetical protein FJW23_17050 [Acidimicrobiia bacterium]|nr:hypothetical protein [Acidimicrobiia bacterium]